MMKRLLLLLIFSFLFAYSASAITVSTGSGVKVIGTLEEINIEEGKPYTSVETIVVPNDNPFPVKVVLTLDEVMSKIAYLIDDEFILQPGEKKNAQFEITLKSAGNYEGRIWSAFQEVDEDSTGIGSKPSMASKIKIIAKGYVDEDWYNYATSIDTEDDSASSPSEIDLGDGTDNNDEDSTVSFGGGSGDRDVEKTTDSDEPSILIGIMIVVIIVIVGLIAFFVISKLLR